MPRTSTTRKPRIEIRFDRHHHAHRAALREYVPELARLFDRPGRTQ